MDPLRLLLASAALLLSCGAAHAQLFRAYLASYGHDTDDCTVATPCRLLPRALAAVADHGEVWILDSANFNQATVDIGKSVTILAIPGQVGSVSAIGGGPAMTVTTLGVDITLRNLVIAGNAMSPGTDGVVVSTIASLVVDGCTFAGLAGRGIVVSPLAGGSAVLDVKDSFFHHNGSNAVVVESGTTAHVARSQFVANADGLVANGSFAGTLTTLDLTDSAITAGTHGVLANSAAPGAIARVFVTRTTIHNTSQGLASTSGPAFGSTLVTVSNSTIAGNASGYFQSGGPSTIKSVGNNYIDDNGSNTGTLSPSTTR